MLHRRSRTWHDARGVVDHSHLPNHFQSQCTAVAHLLLQRSNNFQQVSDFDACWHVHSTMFEGDAVADRVAKFAHLQDHRSAARTRNEVFMMSVEVISKIPGLRPLRIAVTILREIEGLRAWWQFLDIDSVELRMQLHLGGIVAGHTARASDCRPADSSNRV